MHYILDDQGEPVGATQDQWIRWFAHARRRLEATLIGHPPVVYVSTIFIGLDRNWQRSGSPVLWESQVLAANRDDAAAHCRYPEVGQQQRYRTRTEALAGHWELVAALRATYEPEHSHDPEAAA